MREARPADPVRNRRVALLAAGVAAGMLGLAFASVPLYTLFCKVTGFGGTTQVAVDKPAQVGSETITIRFDSNIDASLAWNFHPKVQQQLVKVGEVSFAHYLAHNTGSATSKGSAVFNVTPPEAGLYFNKIACFCFTEQTLKPGERLEMPVQYFVDPAILEDADTKGIREITLSYTFYPVTEPAAARQEATTVN
jgi:cytochrome c oxidase assembly protein subunit 11